MITAVQFMSAGIVGERVIHIMTVARIAVAALIQKTMLFVIFVEVQAAMWFPQPKTKGNR
jgi:hypothetical protein